MPGPSCQSHPPLAKSGSAGEIMSDAGAISASGVDRHIDPRQSRRPFQTRDALRRAAGRCLDRVRCPSALVGLGVDDDAHAHVISIGQDARSPLKASRRSVLPQPTHSSFRCSYPAAFMVASCSIRAIRISAPHETHNMANRPAPNRPAGSTLGNRGQTMTKRP